MASELVGFEKHKDFLVCVDSDGCAMDTMDVKHEKAFCPQLIRVFGLEQYALLDGGKPVQRHPRREPFQGHADDL